MLKDEKKKKKERQGLELLSSASKYQKITQSGRLTVELNSLTTYAILYCG